MTRVRITTVRPPRVLAIALVLASLSITAQAEAPVPDGFWISDDLTPTGLGATLRFSPDGQVQATSGVILKLEWKLIEELEDGYMLSFHNPSKPDDSSTVELRRVAWGEGMI